MQRRIGLHNIRMGKCVIYFWRPSVKDLARSAYMRFQRWGASQETGENRESCCTDGDLRSRASHGLPTCAFSAGVLRKRPARTEASHDLPTCAFSAGVLRKRPARTGRVVVQMETFGQEPRTVGRPARTTNCTQAIRPTNCAQAIRPTNCPNGNFETHCSVFSLC